MNKLVPNIISQKPLIRNMDKWSASTNHNVLYIVGQSGSGKTYLSNQYAMRDKSTPVHIIHLDDLVHWTSTDPNWIRRINKSSYDPYVSNIFNLAYKELGEDGMHKFFEWFRSKYSSDGHRYIIEGLPIAYLAEVDKPTAIDIYRNDPLIIIRRSQVESFLRALHRRYTTKDGDISIRHIKKNIKNRKKWTRTINNMSQYLDY